MKENGKRGDNLTAKKEFIAAFVKLNPLPAPYSNILYFLL
jgi:hypothetical protein